METFKESLVEKKSIRPSESNDVFKCHAGTNYELQNIIKLIIKNGKFKREYECAVIKMRAS